MWLEARARRGAFWFIAAAGRRRRAFVGLRACRARRGVCWPRGCGAGSSCVFVVFLRLSFSVFYGPRFPRLRFAGAERGSRDSRDCPYPPYRVRATSTPARSVQRPRASSARGIGVRRRVIAEPCRNSTAS